MGNKLNKVDPIDPDIVLLGLILVSFFPPINLPLIYPPISENIHTDKIIIRSFLLEL